MAAGVLYLAFDHYKEPKLFRQRGMAEQLAKDVARWKMPHERLNAPNTSGSRDLRDSPLEPKPTYSVILDELEPIGLGTLDRFVHAERLMLLWAERAASLKRSL